MNGVPAGGDLTGAYPNPGIAPNAVNGTKVADGSLGSADLGSLAGVQLGLSTIPDHGIDFGGEFALFRSATQTLTSTGHLRVSNRELSVRQGFDDRITLTPQGRLVLNQNNGSGTIELLEQISDPSAPAAQRGRLYLRDNGMGNSQLVVEWAGGAVSVLATGP